MIQCLDRRRLVAILVLLPLLCSRVSFAAPFQSPTYGYQLAIPDDWKEIPAEIVQSTMKAIRGQNATSPLVYDAAFQTKANPQWFAYPYVVVQVIPYSQLGLNRQINEDEFPAVIKSIAGTDISKAMDKEMSPQAKAMMSDSSIGRPELDKARRRFTLTTGMTVAGIGKMKGKMTGYFGHESLVQVCFYTLERDWNRDAATGEAIADSFRFNPDKDYSVTAASSSGRALGSKVVEKALGGAILGGVIGLVVYLASRFTKKKA